MESKSLCMLTLSFAVLIMACGGGGSNTTPDPTPPTPPSPWVATGNLTTPRAGYVAEALADSRILIAGGSSGSFSSSLASAELYDPATGTCTATGSMATARRYGASVRIPTGPDAGKVLVTGGVNGSTALDSAELFNPTTGTFTPTGNMTTPRYMHQSIALESGPHSGKILILGGAPQYGPNLTGLRSAELFDPTTSTFSPLGQMQLGRFIFSATVLTDGRILIAGGMSQLDAITATAEIFDPTTSTFTATGSLTVPRCQQGACRLADGRVLLAGGVSTGSYLATAELYNSTTGTFTPTGGLAQARAYAPLVLLPGGSALIVGGSGDDSLTQIRNNAERFDPTTSTWTPAGSMQDRRYNTQAIVIPGGPKTGKVFIAGGWTGSGVATRSADLY